MDKTTTIQVLTTLLAPTSGDAKVDGFSLKTQVVSVDCAIGYFPQAISVVQAQILQKRLRELAERNAFV